MYCRGCDYPLKGLAEPRCPECGREFDPGNANTYLNKLRGQAFRKWMLRIRIALLPIAISWFFIVAWNFRIQSVAGYIYSDIGHAAQYLLVWALLSWFFGAALLIPLLWLGSRYKTYAIGVLLCLTIPLLAAEGVASYEEAWFASQCKKNPGQFPVSHGEYYHFRWFSNRGKLIFYDPVTKKLFSG
jgi:hypothetical protein